MKHLFYKYNHAYVFLYFLIYLPWFTWLEKNITFPPKYMIEIPLDYKIPFCEYFIIPYMLWFFFIAIVVCYFFFQNRQEFYRLIYLLFIGMTLFLIISTLFPNGQQLRPTTFERQNIFTQLVQRLYRLDTPTNILPSIHVYNTLCVYYAIKVSSHMKQSFSHNCYLVVLWLTRLLSISIILSTVLLKQHSILDVIGAFLLFLLFCPMIYKVGAKNYSYDKKAFELH